MTAREWRTALLCGSVLVTLWAVALLILRGVWWLGGFLLGGVL